MSGRIDGKVALVTGGASCPGLGYSIAERFAREGATVYISDIDEKGAKEASEKLNEAGGTTYALNHDVTSEADWDKVFNTISKQSGQLDILVNNAGVALLGPIEAQTTPNFNKQMDINSNSVYYGMQRAVEAMRKSGAGGSIVNISSVCGQIGVPGCLAYAAAKGAVKMMTKVVALETARQNIRVNSVHPGFIATNIQADAVRDNPDFYDEIAASIPNGRYGEPEDVANLVLFLASDEASYITGSELTIDGGMTAQ
ncbi:SDR family NAD(P)-dependent oxidoreductase [Litorimonas haliclonae]|uniref:SDR family NAD(P)-dependent oxidoreductase n=1 Tax=Litorimonas haliclonae TaxID=2081977 RepID=UPI0039F113E4